MINAQDYTDLTPITNSVIKDQDWLLVSFGDVSALTFTSGFKTVASTTR